MKTKIMSFTIIITLITIMALFLVFPTSIMSTVTFSISIWKDNLIPSLAPFFLISELLINYGFVELLGEISKNIMNRLFHLPGEASFVIIGSLISGFPSSSKYINELLSNNQINENEASYLLKFNHFSNPLFVLGTVGTLLLNNKSIGLLILVSHIISNFIIAFIYRPKENNYKIEKISLRKGLSKMHKKYVSNTSFSDILSKSIFKTINTLLLLLGIITTFLIISALIKNIFNTSDLVNSIISGILEMTGGIKSISFLNISTKLKATLIGFFISFGGLSIHMQVMSILSDTNIKYLPYLISRIIHALLTSSLIYLTFDLFI